MPRRTKTTPRGTTPIAILTILAIIAVVVTSVLGARRFAEERIERDVDARLEQSSELAAVAAAENVDRMAVIVDAVARLPQVGESIQRADRQEMAQLARTLQQATRGARSGAVAATDGTLLAVFPAAPELLGQRFAERDWYRGVQYQSPYLSEAFVSATNDAPRVATIAVDVRNARDERAGIVTVSIETEYFGRALERAASADGAPELRIVDQSDQVVATSGSRGEGARVSRSAKIRGTEWTLIASLDEDEAFADLRDVRVAASSFVFIVCALLLVLASILFANARRLASARVAEDRREQAFELNDTIVQRLAVSHMALSLGRRDEAMESLEAALDAGRRIIGELASGRDDYVRVEAASPRGGPHDPSTDRDGDEVVT